MTTPRIGREVDEEIERGRILCPEKSLLTLPPMNGDRKLVERDAREEEENAQGEIFLFDLE